MAVDFDKLREELADDFDSVVKATRKLKALSETERLREGDWAGLEDRLENIRNRIVIFICLESDGGDVFKAVEKTMLAVRVEDQDDEGLAAPSSDGKGER